MKRILARRPSPAMVVSCIALFVALSGVSYGVATGYIDSREIKNNTIRTADLRNDEVRTQDIRNSTIRGRDIAADTLTGADIDESKLALPAAAQEAVRLVGTSGQPTFAGTYANTACADCLKTGFWKDSVGVVHLQGQVSRSSGNAKATIFNLPAGYRPAGTVDLAGATVEITVDGDVSAKEAKIYLDGLTFRPR